MTTSDDIRGLEYDWLAVDAEGFVGLLSTAGGGYVPEAFLRSIDAVDSAIDTIMALPPLLRLSAIVNFRQDSQTPGN